MWKHIQEAGVKQCLYFVQGCRLCRGHYPPLTLCYISESLEHGGDTKPHLEAEWCYLQPLPFCWQAWFCFLSPRNADFSKSSSWMRTLGTEQRVISKIMSLFMIDYGVSSLGEVVTVCMYQVGRLGLQNDRCLLNVAHFLIA